MSLKMCQENIFCGAIHIFILFIDLLEYVAKVSQKFLFCVSKISMLCLGNFCLGFFYFLKKMCLGFFCRGNSIIPNQRGMLVWGSKTPRVVNQSFGNAEHTKKTH